MNRRPILLYLLLAGTLYAAQTETIVPPEDQVSEFDARRELASVLRKLGKIEAAENELRKLLQIRPKDPALLADLADLEASRGHFGRSRDLQLLELDRLHTLANQAIERREFSPKSGTFHAVYLLGRDGYWPCFRHRAAISPIRRRICLESTDANSRERRLLVGITRFRRPGRSGWSHDRAPDRI